MTPRPSTERDHCTIRFDMRERLDEVVRRLQDVEHLGDAYRARDPARFPLCPFVLAHLRRHPEQRVVLAGHPASGRRPSRCQREASP